MTTALKKIDAPSASKLGALRSQLAGLRRARAGVRGAVAWSALGIAILAALAGLFALDLIFELAVPQRIVVLLIAAGCVAWAYKRFTRPFLGAQEDEIEMALLVERQQQIDSDLVAALQFESPRAFDWGSPQLTGAVIDYVAAVGRGINVFEGFSRQQMVRRLGLLGAGLAAGLIAAAIWPGHLAAFANRLLLGSRHYPTRTVIEQVVVNRTAVLIQGGRGSNAPNDANAAQGRPVAFLVQCVGDLPAAGTVQLAATGASRGRTKLDLKPLKLDVRLARLQEARSQLSAAAVGAAGQLDEPFKNEVGVRLRFDAPQAAELLAKAKMQFELPAVLTALDAELQNWPANNSRKAILSGELTRLNDGVSYKLFAGDAWTDPATIRMIPLPIVELTVKPVPPKYAQSAAPTAADSSGRQLAVLEGSAVELSIQCTNGKQLKSAWLTIQTKSATQRYDLAPFGAAGDVWRPRVADSPLKSIREEMRYEVQVVDTDGLSLETPLRGTIRIRPDRLPNGLAEIVHKVVLPSAEPVIEYRASDDYGIAQLAIVAEVERHQDTRTSDATAAPAVAGETPQPSDAGQIPAAAAVATETRRVSLLSEPGPLVLPRLPVTGRYRFSLSPLNLAKGDRVKLTLEVIDYRGENEAGQPTGLAYQADPLVLEISDLSGVQAAIAAADEQSEKRINDIITRQLGIGAAP